MKITWRKAVNSTVDGITDKSLRFLSIVQSFHCGIVYSKASILLGFFLWHLEMSLNHIHPLHINIYLLAQDGDLFTVLFVKVQHFFKWKTAADVTVQ
jgi:hypothetical protein